MKLLEDWQHQKDYRFGASTGAKGADGNQDRGNVYHRRIYRLLQMHAAVSLPGSRLLVEPWFKACKTQRLCSPDTVLIDDARQQALVIEVKLNWQDGRDEKLLNLYLPVVSNVFGMPAKPLLITQNLRGYEHPPLLGIGDMEKAWKWRPCDHTPLMLLIK